jgi:hypothetical protein
MQNVRCSWALVTHACHPRYSGGRNQEDCSSKPAQQIVCETLPWEKKKKKTFTKKELVEWLQLWALSSNPSTAKTTTKK